MRKFDAIAEEAKSVTDLTNEYIHEYIIYLFKRSEFTPVNDVAIEKVLEDL